MIAQVAAESSASAILADVIMQKFVMYSRSKPHSLSSHLLSPFLEKNTLEK